MHCAAIALLLPLLGATAPATKPKAPSGVHSMSTEGIWTWTGGSNQVNQFGVYGTKGVPDAGNFPGARHGSVTWRTANGDLWLFGGSGYSALGSGYLNDLWRWDGAAWTWIGGSDVENQPGVYGEQGVASPDNVPSARFAAASSIDSAGNLWLFGGWRYTDTGGTLNDLWKWDGSAWTWVKGSSAPYDLGHWGTLGVPDPANVPRSRRSAAAWTDAAGRFWIMGGYGAVDRRNQDDLWRWDGTNWTWMSGGGQYLTSLARRTVGATWVDQAGNLWLFGGYRTDGTDGFLNDLWRWDGTNWAMVGGSWGYGADGVYGTRGVAAPANIPGARSGAASWTDNRGNVWLLGGDGHTANGDGNLNDLWRWDGTNWAWIRGADAPSSAGVYGDPGTPAPGNDPGGRFMSASWASSSGDLRLLGGAGHDSAGVVGELRDFWLYAPPDCTPPPGVLVAPASVLDGSSANGASVSDAGAGATYEWTIAGGTLDSGQGTPSVLFTAIPGAASVVLGITVRKGDCATGDEKTIPVGVYHALEIVRNGVGNDLVGSTPGDIWCGSTCTAIFPHGAAVELTPYPGGATSRFAGWLGGGCSGTGACVVTMDGPKTISATFFPAAPAKFYSVPPCRVVDTRNPDGPLAGPALAAGAARAFTVGGACGVPVDATAVALNVTVTGPTGPGFLTLYPGTGPAPDSSVVSFTAGRTRASNVSMGLVAGSLSVFDRQETGTVHLVLDVSGYYR